MGSGYLTNPQSWNRYTYVLSNPLNIIDPSGLDGEEPTKKDEAQKQTDPYNDGVYYAPGQFQVGSGIPLFYEDPVVITAPADPIDFQHGPGEEFFKSYLEFAVVNGVFNVVGAFSGPIFGGLKFVDDAGNVYNSANQALNAAKAGAASAATSEGSGTGGGDNWIRTPSSIQDRMTLEAAQKGAGDIIMENLNDGRYKGMEKWQYKVKSSEGKDSVVHYVRDPKTGKLMDFKFKKRSTDGLGSYESNREGGIK